MAAVGCQRVLVGRSGRRGRPADHGRKGRDCKLREERVATTWARDGAGHTSSPAALWSSRQRLVACRANASASADYFIDDDGVDETGEDAPGRALETESDGSGRGYSGGGVPVRRALRINLDLMSWKAGSILRKSKAERRHKEVHRKLVDQAEALYRRCLELDPVDGRAYVGLGRLYIQNGDVQGARAIFEDGAAACQGENAHIWQAWATLEGKEGNVQRARELYDAGTVADNTHAASWHGWAMMEMKQGNLSRAKELLSKGLKFQSREKPNGHMVVTMANLESSEGHIEQARLLYRRAQKLLPQNQHLLHSWACLEAREGNIEAARELFQQARDVCPWNAFVTTGWAAAELRVGDTARAEEILRQGDSRDAMVLQVWGVLKAKQGDVDAARKYYAKGLNALSRKMNRRAQLALLQAWGMLEWRDGAIDRARSLFREASDLKGAKDKRLARVLQAWGALEAAEGNVDCARSLFRRGTVLDPKNAVIYESWALLEQNYGSTQESERLNSVARQIANATFSSNSSWPLL